MGSGGSWYRLCPPPQENHKLRDQNDDLNGQILSLSLYEAKNLFATQTKAQSLAAEIDTASRDEVMCPAALAWSLAAHLSCPIPPVSMTSLRLPRAWPLEVPICSDPE